MVRTRNKDHASSAGVRTRNKEHAGSAGRNVKRRKVAEQESVEQENIQNEIENIPGSKTIDFRVNTLTLENIICFIDSIGLRN